MQKIVLGAFLAASASTVSADSYIDGGVKWDFYVPRINEPVHDFEPESELQARVTNLGVHDNGLGEDADRINTIVPIVGDNFARINLEESFGATMGGFHKYETYYTEKPQSPRFNVRKLRFDKPIEILNKFGSVNELSVPEYTLINRVSATFTLAVPEDDTLIFKFRAGYKEIDEKVLKDLKKGVVRASLDNYQAVDIREVVDKLDGDLSILTDGNYSASDKCAIGVFINGQSMALDDEYDRASFIWKAKAGSYEVRYVNACTFDTDYIGSYLPTTERIISDLDFEIYSNNNKAVLRSENFKNKRPKYKLQKQSDYSEFEKSNPYLYGWTALDLENFITPEQMKYQKMDDIDGVVPSLEEVNTASIELVSEELQDQLLDDKVQGLRKLLKGTFHPKVEGKYNLLVMKLSNVIDTTNSDTSTYLQPIYGISFDNRSAMAHSRLRDKQRSDNQFEFDWFNFDVRKRDVKNGMEFSFFGMANIGRNTIRNENCSAAFPCGESDRALRDVLNNQVVKIRSAKATEYGSYASQKIAIYIKAPNEKFYRPLQMSDMNPQQDEKTVNAQLEKFNASMQGEVSKSDEEELDLMSSFD